MTPSSVDNIKNVAKYIGDRKWKTLSQSNSEIYSLIEPIKSVGKLNQTKLIKKSVFRWDADTIITWIRGGLRRLSLKEQTFRLGITVTN